MFNSLHMEAEDALLLLLFLFNLIYFKIANCFLHYYHIEIALNHHD